MTRLRHPIVINRPLKEVYALAEQVERYPEFLPGYIESRIIGRDGQRILLARKAKIDNTLHAWMSWATFEPPHTIHFEHAEGPLKGMQVFWQFLEIAPFETELVIVHWVD